MRLFPRLYRKLKWLNDQHRIIMDSLARVETMLPTLSRIEELLDPAAALLEMELQSKQLEWKVLAVGLDNNGLPEHKIMLERDARDFFGERYQAGLDYFLNEARLGEIVFIENYVLVQIQLHSQQYIVRKFSLSPREGNSQLRQEA